MPRRRSMTECHRLPRAELYHAAETRPKETAHMDMTGFSLHIFLRIKGLLAHARHFENNRSRTRYPECRRMGLTIGSGMVESAAT